MATKGAAGSVEAKEQDSLSRTASDIERIHGKACVTAGELEHWTEGLAQRWLQRNANQNQRANADLASAKGLYLFVPQGAFPTPTCSACGETLSSSEFLAAVELPGGRIEAMCCDCGCAIYTSWKAQRKLGDPVHALLHGFWCARIKRADFI